MSCVTFSFGEFGLYPPHLPVILHHYCFRVFSTSQFPPGLLFSLLHISSASVFTIGGAQSISALKAEDRLAAGGVGCAE